MIPRAWPLIVLLFLSHIFPAPATDLPASRKHVQGKTVKMVQGNLLMKTFNGELMMILNVPKDFLVIDGSVVNVGIDRDTLKPFQFSDHGRMRTVLSAVAYDGPYAWKSQPLKR